MSPIYADTAHVQQVIEVLVPHCGFDSMPAVKRLDAADHESDHDHARPGATFDLGGYLISVLDIPERPADRRNGIKAVPAQIKFLLESVTTTPGSRDEPPLPEVSVRGTFRSLTALFREIAEINLSVLELTAIETLKYEAGNRVDNVMPRVNGQPFRCDCGGNVFSRLGTPKIQGE